MLVMNVMLVALCIYLYRQNNRCSFTGLLNKAQFNRDSIARMRRKNDMIILIDIDKFKAINDTHGHGYGDQVILDVARAIKANIRMSDRAYRIGGDEFAIITNNISVGARIKQQLGVSISVGNGQSYQEADANMYDNKRATVKNSFKNYYDGQL
jgi:GGDEF domain-containing protein